MVVLLTSLLVASPTRAIHRQAPPGMRATSGGPHQLPPTRSWGYTIAFTSSVDLVSTGNTSRQVFVWNIRRLAQNLIRCRKTGACGLPRRPDLAQITPTGSPGSPDNGSANVRYVAFDADGAYGGGSGPQASRRQIFLYDTRTQALVQVTSSGAGDSVQPSVDAASRAIVFESTAPLTGTGPAGVRQIFAALLPSLEIVRITAGQGPSSTPIPDRRSERVVFQSTADLDGTGADTGISQIFVAIRNAAVAPPTFTLRRLTRGNAPSQHATLDEHGQTVAFDSAATNLAADASAPGGTQVYLASTAIGWDDGLPSRQPGLRQVTHAIPSGPGGPPVGDCSFPSLDPTGFHLAFVCTADLLGNGTSGNRLFALDLRTGTLGQLTGRGAVIGPLSHAVGRFLIAFTSDNDIAGTGACGPQLQAINAFAGRWTAATQPGELPPDFFDYLVPPAPTVRPVSTNLSPGCDDGDFCTADRCDAGGGCLHVSKDAACSDGDPCTLDVCTTGVGCEHSRPSGCP